MRNWLMLLVMIVGVISPAHADEWGRTGWSDIRYSVTTQLRTKYVGGMGGNLCNHPIAVVSPKMEFGSGAYLSLWDAVSYKENNTGCFEQDYTAGWNGKLVESIPLTLDMSLSYIQKHGGANDMLWPSLSATYAFDDHWSLRAQVNEYMLFGDGTRLNGHAWRELVVGGKYVFSVEDWTFGLAGGLDSNTFVPIFYNVEPTISYRLTDNVSVGGGWLQDFGRASNGFGHTEITFKF